MDINTLVHKLNTLFISLRDLYNINNGGCCYTAYLIAKEFDKRDIAYSLRIFNTYITSEYLCLKAIRNDYDRFPIHSETATHYSIKCDGIVINPEEDCEDFEYLDLNNINSDFILDIYNKGCWNSEYDTKNSIFIERFIKIIFDQYDTENKNFEM